MTDEKTGVFMRVLQEYQGNMEKLEHKDALIQQLAHSAVYLRLRLEKAKEMINAGCSPGSRLPMRIVAISQEQMSLQIEIAESFVASKVRQQRQLNESR